MKTLPLQLAGDMSGGSPNSESGAKLIDGKAVAKQVFDILFSAINKSRLGVRSAIKYVKKSTNCVLVVTNSVISHLVLRLCR